MDPHVAELLGIDLTDPEVQRDIAAIDRDMRLVETLVSVRKDRGLTQAEVAERMGRTQPAVSDFERLGGDPHLSTIRRYALAVGVDVVHTVIAPGDVSVTRSTPGRICVEAYGNVSETSATASLNLRAATS
ncbi:helix-turn-helix domain-containing protein [Nonomuraea sp. NPDC050790]|uniref:helix-turn-helix domain-containing protein n=1 Tax=Nonomuraea sp. NPDC050790 TaxID=3364371 RepID=UPI00378EC0C9